MSLAKSPLASSLKLPLPMRLLALMAVALAWVFWVTFLELGQRWGSQSQYSHGWLVPVYAGVLLWLRRGMLADIDWRPSWWGLPLLLFGLAMRFGGVFVEFQWLAAAALLPCLAAACLLAGGWPVLRWAWPAIGFLIFMVPLPFTIEVGLSHPLQRIGTIVSTFTLQTLGVAAYAEGNIIVMGETRIGVVEACSGLSMLMIFFALSTAVTLLSRRSPLERTVIFLSAVPIALASNIIRIVATAILHKIAGRELADLVFHDLAGWLMMPLALGMLWLIMRLLDWLLVPIPEREPALPEFAWAGALTGASPATAPKTKSSVAGESKR
jgi:exosortase